MARHTFFSFHYADVQRATVVRKSDFTKDPGTAGFFDKSLWEDAKSKNVDALKALIRDSVSGTSVTCILNGSETCLRPWVRYEIVRGVLNGNGLVTVDINGICDWERNIKDKGRNALDYLGVYKANDQIWFADWYDGKWRKYPDYTLSISASALWFNAPESNNVMQLSRYAARWDYAADNGYKYLDGWIDSAATTARK